MKIACDACEAKYSISDDKVRGKVFKIRCKKCSNVIIVRGVDNRVWHLVVREDQIGPLTIDEVRARFLDGDIDGETYTWREGQADWLPLASIEELAAISTPTSIPALPSDPIVESNIAKLRGERNESSVLFSLGNLAQIATRAPARAAAGLETHSSTQEGSGLIDIRSMASAYLGGGMMAKPVASIGSIDDLPVFNTGSAFSEPAVLVPSPIRAAPSKLMYLMIAAIVAFATVAIVLLVMLLRRDPTPTSVVAIREPASLPHVAPSPPAAPPPVVVQPQPTPPPPPPPEAPKQAAPKLRPKVVAPPAAPKQAKTETPAKDECDEIYCVVNTDAVCCKAHAAKAPPKQLPPPPPKSDLPEQLTSSMITTAMNAVRPRVMACGDKSSAKGRVRVHLKVGNDGKITNTTVEEAPDAALGACVAAVVNRATFPATQAGRSFSVPYTF